MPLLPPLITHTPNLTQLYASSNINVGGVDSVVAGINISVNSTNPEAPIVSAPNVLAKQITYLNSQTALYASPPAAGSTITNFGTTFQVPTTGLYIVSASYGVNVDAITGATFGLIDSIGIGITPSPPIIGVGASVISFRPYSMPATPVGGDYGYEATFVYPLIAGTNYQPFVYTDNFSGTMAFGAGVVAAQINVIALC